MGRWGRGGWRLVWMREGCVGCVEILDKFSHAATLNPDIQAAMQMRGLKADWTAQSLARHFQAVLPGAFILAKAGADPVLAQDSIAHLKRYVQLMFSTAEKGKSL